MSDVYKLEEEIESAKHYVELRAAALRLEGNPDFRKIFVEGYFLEDAARLVQLSTEPRMKEEDRQAALEEAKATGYMRRHLSDIVQMGYTALNKLPALYAELEEARAEEHADSYADVADEG